MAYPWAALERVRASDLNAAIGASDWASYTPTIGNGGSATFTTLTGRWRRDGPTSASRIEFSLTFTVNAAGSGAGTVTFTTPTSIDRTMRFVFVGQAESGGGGLTGVYAVALQSGTGAVVDRIRYLTATNLTGADLTAGRIFAFSGFYEEA